MKPKRRVTHKTRENKFEASPVSDKVEEPTRPLTRPECHTVLYTRENRKRDAAAPFSYSHSMVPGGFDVTSSTTRLTSGTWLVILFEMRASTS